MSADKQPEIPLDNDREVRALALRFALDLTKDYRALFTKEAEPLPAPQVLADAQAFDSFIRTGRVMSSYRLKPAPAPEEPTDV